jgi:hypothetical protein
MIHTTHFFSLSLRLLFVIYLAFCSTSELVNGIMDCIFHCNCLNNVIMRTILDEMFNTSSCLNIVLND